MDPVLTLFTWLTQLGTLAITYLMAVAAGAVAVFFMKNKGLDSNPWRTVVAPWAAAVGLLALAVFATTKFSFLINTPGSVLNWLLPLLIPVGIVVGVISAAMLRSREPEAFAQMGRHRGIQLHE